MEDRATGFNSYANIDWLKGWNNVNDVSSYSQNGSNILAIGWWGQMRFDLSDKKATDAIINQTREFANMIEQLQETWATDHPEYGQKENVSE